jgi:hypothetical protein
MWPIQLQSHLVSWKILRAYFKAELKGSDDKAPPCIDHFA